MYLVSLLIASKTTRTENILGGNWTGQSPVGYRGNLNVRLLVPLLGPSEAGPGLSEAGSFLLEAGPGLSEAGSFLLEAGPGLSSVYQGLFMVGQGSQRL